MIIKNIWSTNGFSLSFEVFPPVREGNLESLYRVIDELKELKPDFISVTYGAGGSTRDKTIEIVSKVKNDFMINALAHLTCVNAKRDDISNILDDLQNEGIDNILALRGDPPASQAHFVPTAGGFAYADELVAFIALREHFCIGVAGYPEKHVEAPSMDADLENLKRKVDAGADFIITQLFFNNDDYYRFRDLALARRINVPIIPGIFPLLNHKQLLKIADLCGPKIPFRLGEIMEKWKDRPEETEKFGIDYAVAQAADLLENGVPGLHIYSMNRSQPVIRIVKELSLSR